MPPPPLSRPLRGGSVTRRMPPSSEPSPQLPQVTPDYYEILVVRELRKVGLEVADLRIHRRTELPEPERGFLLELRAGLSRGEWRRTGLIVCRRQEGPVGSEAVESVAGRLAEARAEVGLLFSTADFTPDALRAAGERGVALLRLVDSRRALDLGGWGAPGHYPAWLPAYLVQVVDQDPEGGGGQTRYRLLEAGRSDIILERFQPRT